jgi:hypothetical protein
MEKVNSIFMSLIKDETRSKSIITRSATATYSEALQPLAMQLEEQRWSSRSRDEARIATDPKAGQG